MNTDSILREIENNSPEDDKAALKAYLNLCTTKMQWLAFTTCRYEQTGKYSYQSKRIWILNDNIKRLFE